MKEEEGGGVLQAITSKKGFIRKSNTNNVIYHHDVADL
jgi:hypothetical protein